VFVALLCEYCSYCDAVCSDDKYVATVVQERKLVGKDKQGLSLFLDVAKFIAAGSTLVTISGIIAVRGMQRSLQNNWGY
jgi:hypothetical protein